MTAVHQLLPVFSVEDAIGSAVRRTQAMLRRMGFESHVYAELWDERLAGTRPADRLLEDVGPQDCVLYHLSIGAAAARIVERFPGRRVVVYHNITPPTYYRGVNPRVTYWLEQGQRDLARLVPAVDLVIGVSEYNLRDCLPFRPRRTAVVPVPLDLERLRPRPSKPQSPPLLLFVGRAAPNKRLEELVRVLAALRATAVADARLALVGGSEDTERYVAAVRAFADALGVADAVDLEGRRRSDAEVGDLYARAAVYVCASEHEGFCVPLLEAMAFDVPVVALAAGAVPETAGEAAVLLGHRDPLVWAAVIARVLGDADLRHALVAAGRRRLADFSLEAVERRLASALAGIGIVPDAADASPLGRSSIDQ